MRKTSLNSFKDYPFQFEFKLRFISGLISANVLFLYPKPIILVTLFILFVLSLLNTLVFNFFIPLLGIYLYNYHSIKKIKNGIKIKRNYNPKSKEENEERVTYHISNPYSLNFSNLFIKDQFNGEKIVPTKNSTLFYKNELKQNHREVIKKDYKLNNGMGKKQFGPMSMILSDPLGINQLKIVHDDESYLEVFPKIYPTKAPMTTPFEHSIEYGLFDSITRGENVNFYKTREYQPGDSINKINWKLSLKDNTIIVNEYENNSNSKVNIILFDDQRLHVGDGADSSFEYCKDIALSLCQHHISSNDSIGLFCHQKYLKPMSGKSHLLALEIFAAGLKLKEFPVYSLYHKTTKIPTEVIEFENRLKHLIDKESNTYIITSIMPGKLWKYYFQLIRSVAMRSKTTHLTLVDGLGHILSKSHKDDQNWMAQIHASVPKEIEELKIFSEKNNITLSVVKVDARTSEPMRVRNAFERA